MLTRNDLKSYMDITGFNLGQVEKDYLQHIFLLNFYKKIKDEIIFKGGTALQKNYGLNRFSEDLDFTMKSDINMEPVLSHITTSLKIFGYESIKKKLKEDEISKNYHIKIKGPLFNGTEQSHTYIKIEISKREKIILPVITNTITPIYKDLPPYTVSLVTPEEIMAEKIKAIITRDNARDIYDLWFLTQKKIKIPVSLINSKLKYFKKEFNYKEFEKSIEKKEKIYNQEMEQLIPALINFEEIKNILFQQDFIK